MNKKGVVWAALILVSAVTVFVIMFLTLKSAVVLKSETISQSIRAGSGVVAQEGQLLAMLQTPFESKPLVQHIIDKAIFDTPMDGVENELESIFKQLLEWDNVCVRIAVDNNVVSRNDCAEATSRAKFYGKVTAPRYYSSRAIKSDIEIQVYRLT